MLPRDTEYYINSSPWKCALTPPPFDSTYVRVNAGGAVVFHFHCEDQKTGDTIDTDIETYLDSGDLDSLSRSLRARIEEYVNTS